MSYDKVGGVSLPLVSVADGASLVTQCDPAVSTLLAAFKAILKTKLDPAWSKAAKGISSTVVAEAYPYEPNRPGEQMTWLWPALFMWRISEDISRRTQHQSLASVTGGLALVLPPLPMDLYVKLESIRVAARAALMSIIDNNGDETYSSGAKILTAAGVESFHFTKVQYGYLPSESMGMMHPALNMTWIMRERETLLTSHLSAATRVDTTINLKSETDATSVSIAGFQYDPTDDVPSGNG